jgi:hypothetical protein
LEPVFEVGLNTEFRRTPNLFRASLFIIISRFSFLRDLLRFCRPVFDLSVRPDTLARRLLRNLLSLERGIVECLFMGKHIFIFTFGGGLEFFESLVFF